MNHNQKARPSAALARAQQMQETPWSAVTPRGRARRKWYAIGDPQAPAARFFEILDRGGLLGEDGRLDPDVGLLSIGDHFDHPGNTDEVARSGLAVLRWLAEHPPDQVVILAGNHDLSRVMELIGETDESFARARAVGAQIRSLEKAGADPAEVAALERVFNAEFPRIPSPGIAARDYSSFTVAQRALVQSLLLAGRFALGAVGSCALAPEVLLVHAGVTARELDGLSVPSPHRPADIARRLNELLAGAVDRVRAPWLAGGPVPLDLSPVHISGTAGEEGGGLLYHRPAAPPAAGNDDGWAFNPRSPRRFDPRTLPKDLVQVCGHTGHAKCLIELKAFADEAAHAQPCGGLRTLASDGDTVSYRLGLRAPRHGEATMYLIDSEMAKPDVADYPLFELAQVVAPPA